MSEPFVAEIRIFAFNFAPKGWAFCDGQLLPISQNTALFSLVGTTYGGDGKTTFALPNLQDSVPIHAGRGPGLTARRLGERGGSASVNLTVSQMPTHSHAVNANASNPAITGTPANGLLLARGESMYITDNTALQNMDQHTLTQTGGSQSHNNLQPYLVLNFCMALVGLYPSRS